MFQFLSADPKKKATKVTRQLKAREGNIAPAEEEGPGEGASTAREALKRENTVIATAIRAIREAVVRGTAI